MSESSVTDYANELKKVTDHGRMADVNELINTRNFIEAVAKYGFELLKLLVESYRESFEQSLGNPRIKKVLFGVISYIKPVESHLAYILPKKCTPRMAIDFAEIALIYARRLDRTDDALFAIIEFIGDNILNLPIPSDPKRSDNESIVGQNRFDITDLYATLYGIFIEFPNVIGFNLKNNKFYNEAARTLAGPIRFYYLQSESELTNALLNLFIDYFERNIQGLWFSMDGSVEKNRLSDSLPLVYYFFAQIEGLRARIPAIYNPLYMFRKLSEAAISMGNLEHCGAQEKFLRLIEHGLGLIDDCSINSDWFSAKFHQTLSNNLGWHAVHGFTKDIRLTAVKLVRLYVSKFDDKCKYLWFLHISSVAGHFNFHEFTLHLFRECMLQAVKGEEGNLDYYKNEKLFAVMRAFCELKPNSESENSLISTQFSYAASLLNLFIFAYHTDKQVNVGAATNKNFCEILRKYVSKLKGSIKRAKKVLNDFEKDSKNLPEKMEITLAGDDDNKIVDGASNSPSEVRDQNVIAIDLIEFYISEVSSLYGLK